jgi:hypothetical protein
MNFYEWKEIRKKLDKRYMSSISKNTIAKVRVKDKENAINGLKPCPKEIVILGTKTNLSLLIQRRMFPSP